MLLAEAIKTETNCSLPSQSFSIKASPIAFDILSSKLYSDPILAIVRELLTNAYDSHKAAGTLDIPIHLNIPNYMESNLIIRDYGTGLSKEDVFTLYTTFFGSTKSTSNDFTGCFGLGSKTPFSYTSSFTVVSYFNGMKYTFIAAKKDGYPQILSVSDEPTSEANGLQVSIPVQEYDYEKFRRTITEYLKRIPEIRVDTDITRDEPTFTVDNIDFYSTGADYKYRHIDLACVCIKQGQNIYTLKDAAQKLNKTFYNTTIKRIAKYYDVVINVPIGTLSITPNRESLSIESSSLETIRSIIAKANRDLSAYLAEAYLNSAKLDKRLLDFKDADLVDKYFRYSDSRVLNINISNSSFSVDNRDIIISKLVLTSYSYQKESRLQDNTKSLLIFVPNKCSYHQVRKLMYTIRNYRKELAYDKFYIVRLPQALKVYKHNTNKKIVRYVSKDVSDNLSSYTPYYETYINEIPYLKFIRTFRNVIWTLNNIPEYNFDIDCTNINMFLKKYTNHSKPKEEKEDTIKPSKPNVSSIRAKSLRIYKYTDNDAYQISRNNTEVCKNSMTLYSLEHINSKYLPTNTIVIEKSDAAIQTFYNLEMWYLVFNCFSSIKDGKGNNLLEELLKEEAVKHNISFDTHIWYVLLVNKSNRKYFKDYIYLTMDDLSEYFSSKDFSLVYNSMSDGRIIFLNNFTKIFKEVFSDKEWKLITESTRYKYIKVLQQYVQKSLNINKLNIIIGRENIIQCISEMMTTFLKGRKILNDADLAKKVPAWFRDLSTITSRYDASYNVPYDIRKKYRDKIFINKEGRIKVLKLLLNKE